MSLAARDLRERVALAVRFFWGSRERQATAQKARGRSDRGSRGAVTGGRQMDGFIDLLTELIVRAGATRSDVFHHKKLELPGYFRAEKKWDLLVVREGELVVAIETKSQVGPSSGNNFNNRTEEAIGSGLDLWTGYREGAFNKTVKPWLGYLFLLEDCPRSRSPVRVWEPHFSVLSEFSLASYAKRYEVLCRKLMREQLYNAAAFLTSPRRTEGEGNYSEPANDLTFEVFARSLTAQVAAFGAEEKAWWPRRRKLCRAPTTS